MPVPFTVRELHNWLGATIYVTHDQVEAMTMSDKIVVLRNRSIEQTGAPLDLYDRPANSFVAGFIGLPAMNIFPAAVGENGLVRLSDGTSLTQGVGTDAGIAMMRAGHPVGEMHEARQPAREAVRRFLGRRQAVTHLNAAAATLERQLIAKRFRKAGWPDTAPLETNRFPSLR